MEKLSLTKPDGRELILYSRTRLDPNIRAPSPQDKPIQPNPQMRWHPLRGEWVIYASHRQGRTFLPPPEYDPLAVSQNPKFPTELPDAVYDVAVFENLFPSLYLGAHEVSSPAILQTPAKGRCEVVVYNKEAGPSLGELSLDRIQMVLEVWADRTRELGQRGNIAYVLPFENRGVEVGVTLHHPHAQIYAYPFVPPIAQKEQELESRHFDKNGVTLMSDLLKKEITDERRVLYDGTESLAFVPECARYAYEVWIAPKRATAQLCDLDSAQIMDLARALKTVLLKYDALWKRPFPYIMVIHQSGTQSAKNSGAHLHFEFYPPYRTRDRLKFLAGTELGAGVFASDTLPENTAQELRSVEIASLATEMEGSKLGPS